MKRALILLLASQSLIAAPALAAGFGLKEQSAKAMGVAYAGVAASDQTAADVAYNPAALSGVGDGADFAVSAVEILPSSSANYTVATTAAGTPANGTHTPHGFISDASVPNIGVCSACPTPSPPA